MESILKDLAKLEKLTAAEDVGKSPSIEDSLDAILQSLHEAAAHCESGDVDEQLFVQLSQSVRARKDDIDDRTKAIRTSLNKIGKALDKEFPNALPEYPDLFASTEARAALDRTIAVHLLRTGQFDTAETFIEESGVDIPQNVRAQFEQLHLVLDALERHDIKPALTWAQANRAFLEARSWPLEFALHRAEYLRLLFNESANCSDATNARRKNAIAAIAYANVNLRPFFNAHEAEFKRLMAAVVYPDLKHSPYADSISADASFGRDSLSSLFARAYCARLGMGQHAPLRVVVDVGGGGALSRIEKGRRVMRERRGEWSQSNELPIEIPLAPVYRYHSIFACPISKEQASEDNPPMVLECGHVIAKESLQRMSKIGGRVKCPYCPVESRTNLALQVRF